MTCKVNDRLNLYFTLINRGYDTNDRLKLYFTMIKWDYNTNDWLKFYFTVIEWDYNSNDRLKSLYTKKWDMKSIEWIQSFKIKTNDRRTKNERRTKVGINHRSNSEVPRPRFFFFFLLLLTYFTKMLLM